MRLRIEKNSLSLFNFVIHIEAASLVILESGTVSNDLKEYKSLELFKSKMKNWIPKKYPLKLCKAYLQRTGYVQIVN